MNAKALKVKKKKISSKDIVINLVILILSLIALFPLIWIIVTACKGQVEILKNPLAIIPDQMMFMENLKEVWRRADWVLYYKNTFIQTVVNLVIQLCIAIPAAYAFAVLDFPLKNALFVLVLTRLMVSPESTMLANYMTILEIGAYDTLWGILLPYMVSAMAIFMFRQAFKQIPPSLRESAKLDSCSEFGFMIRVGIPLIKNYIMSFSIITCVSQWNAFFWPMLVTESPDKRILPVALTYFGLQAESGSEWGLTMVAALIVITPLLILFFIFQKKFIDSFITSGIK